MGAYEGATAPPGPRELMRAAHDFVASARASSRRSAPLQSPPLLTFTVRVSNLGPIDTDEAVLGFIIPPGAGGPRGLPLRELFAFVRVRVLANATADVALDLSARDLTFLDERGERFAPGGAFRVEFGVRGTAPGAFAEFGISVDGS